MPDLRVSVVSSSTDNSSDSQIKGVFEGLLTALKAAHPEADYTGIELRRLSYESEPYMLSKHFVGSLTPSKYLASKDALKDDFEAILAVKKVGQRLPYFPAFFIANKDSQITSIESDKIRRIYLVSVLSTSGYIAPLYKLWESGVISMPNERGVREKGWELILVGNQKDVEAEILADKEAIGACGEFCNQDDPEGCHVRPVLRYYNLPQDPIVISRNLLPYKATIAGWFRYIFEKDAKGKFLHREGKLLCASSANMTGVSGIDAEFENALHDLELMIRHVKAVPKQASNSLKIYRIFLASSSELQEDREGFDNFMSRENSEFVKKGFYFEVVRWEHFMDAMSRDGLQQEYNKAIRDSDLFVSLFFTKVGKYTIEEFEVAFGQFASSGRPLIYTYFKNAPVAPEEIRDDSLLKFRETLKSLKHYRTIYKELSDLKDQFRSQLQRFLERQGQL